MEKAEFEKSNGKQSCVRWSVSGRMWESSKETVSKLFWDRQKGDFLSNEEKPMVPRKSTSSFWFKLFEGTKQGIEEEREGVA